MQNFKQERIAQILMEEINAMIVLGRIKDPRVSNRVSVLHVNVAKDVTSATVYISSFLEKSSLKKSVDALNHAKGYIQSQIHKKHKWRNTPRLYFRASTGLQSGEKIIEVLNSNFIEDPIENITDVHETDNG